MVEDELKVCEKEKENLLLAPFYSNSISDKFFSNFRHRGSQIFKRKRKKRENERKQ
jgi:hypothetical protein